MRSKFIGIKTAVLAVWIGIGLAAFAQQFNVTLSKPATVPAKIIIATNSVSSVSILAVNFDFVRNNITVRCSTGNVFLISNNHDWTNCLNGGTNLQAAIQAAMPDAVQVR